MTAKEYLNRIHGYKQNLDKLQESLEFLYAKASGIKAITYDKDRVQVSPENKFESYMVKIDAVAEKYAKMLFIYSETLTEGTERIMNMKNATYSKVLLLRYIDGLRWEEIACKMNYSFRHVTRLHGSALAAFGAQYKDVL